MHYIRLGNSGLQVSRLCLGTMNMGTPDWKPWIFDEKQSEPIVAHALDNGVNFIDLADFYSAGVGEEVVGRILKRVARREDIVVTTRESTDGCWALPGGYADIGLSAAENIVKEIREEAGLSVTARTLYSVMHKAKGLYRPDVRDFYKLYFLCERVDQLAPMAGLETTEVGFFALHDLPPLSRGRTIESDLEAAFAFHRGELTQTLFD